LGSELMRGEFLKTIFETKLSWHSLELGREQILRDAKGLGASWGRKGIAKVVLCFDRTHIVIQALL